MREPQEVVPLGFPVVCRGRGKLCTALNRKNMFCPLHWPLEGIVPRHFKSSQRLIANILVVLCDQRLERDQLNEMVEVIGENL